MAILRICTFGDPILRREARPVEGPGGSLERIVEDMYETMYAAPGVGLAATQVGIEKAFFVYDIGDGPGVLVNPEIVHSEGEAEHEEGCLSLPGMWFTVTRPAEVVARGSDLSGNAVELGGEGLIARMLMHETDHLAGVLIIDRIRKAERKEAMKALRRQALELPSADSH